MVNRKSLRDQGRRATRLLGVVAVAASLAVVGGSIASAVPSGGPPTAEEPALATPSPTETAPATSTPATSAPPATSTGVQADPTSPQARQGLVNTVRSNATGACLDDSSLGLRGFACNGLVFQKWDVIQLDFAQFELQSISTGRCLDHSNDYGLRTVDCNNGSWQKWNIVNKNGGLEIMNRATNKCLDDSNLGVRVISCNSTVHQRWSLGP
ncbi:RICIN domain-containing protein [Rhodococcus sp. 1139]|uniref:RICIN domain-containing protein n=1 Tax=Rhodococcus sp. 1139 TaxID=1833762 RepID=UPI0009F3FF59